MGYRIDIDHAGCITCGICMDVCPVEALDMSGPTSPGIETGPVGGRPLPWMMERPLQVGECIGCGICVRECPPAVMTHRRRAGGERPAGRRARDPSSGPRPAAADEAWIPLSAVTREALKPIHPSPWGDLFPWRTRSRPKPWQVWTTMVDDAPADARSRPARRPAPPAPTPAATSASWPQGRYDEAYAVAAEVNPFPSVCGWICTAPCESACRRGVLDEPIAHPDHQALRRRARQAPRGPEARPSSASREGRDRRRRPRRHVGRLLPRPPRLPGHRPRGDARPRRHDGDRHPRVPPAARGPPGGDPAHRRRSASSSGSTPRWAATSRCPTSSARASRRSSSRPAHRKSRRLGVPGDDQRGVIPATRFLKEVNLGEHPRLSGDVIVVGGGSTAMDAARSAKRSGAATVTIVYRRGRADMPAQAEEIEAAEREGIAILEGLAPTEVVGRDGDVVALRCDGCARRGEAGSGGRAPWAPTGESRELPATAILVAIGEEPDPSILPEGAGIEVSGWAGIVADPRTARDGPRRASSPVATSSRAPRPSSRPWPPVGAPPAPSTSTSRAPATARPRSCATVRVHDPAGADAPARHRRPAARPRAAPGRRHRQLQGHAGGLRRRRPRRPRRRAASAAMPSTAARPSGRAGRGPADSRIGGPPQPMRPSPPRPAHPRHTPVPPAQPGRSPVNADQVSGLFGAGEAFVEGTIAAALVILWILTVALHLARPYMAKTTGKFTLRLGADLWWIIYVGLRDIMLLQVFLGSFIFFYPDVVKGQDLPITGGLAAVCAFAALLIKLMTQGRRGPARGCASRCSWSGIGAALYLDPVPVRRRRLSS